MLERLRSLERLLGSPYSGKVSNLMIQKVKLCLETAFLQVVARGVTTTYSYAAKALSSTFVSKPT